MTKVIQAAMGEGTYFHSIELEIKHSETITQMYLSDNDLTRLKHVANISI
jgi:hypothetical protein